MEEQYDTKKTTDSKRLRMRILKEGERLKSLAV
jgi:hypothetical protein